MKHTAHPYISRLLLVATAGILALAVSAGSAPTPPATQLSVTLESGVDTVTDGVAVTYTAEVRNGGAAVDATVVLDPPDYVTLGDADGADVSDGQATWSVTLEAGNTTTFEIPAEIGEIPEAERRVTALVSVYVGDETAPVVRTAVANHIEGVADEQVTRPNLTVILLWVGGGVLLLAVAAGVIVFVLRSRRGRNGPNSPDEPGADSGSDGPEGSDAPEGSDGLDRPDGRNALGVPAAPDTSVGSTASGDPSRRSVRRDRADELAAETPRPAPPG